MGICPDQEAGLWLSLIGALAVFGCVLWNWKNLGEVGRKPIPFERFYHTASLLLP